jgi:hypothetical protein
MTKGDVASDVLNLFDAQLMRSYPVSSRINDVANDDEGCSTPVKLAESQNSLFPC